MKKPLINSLTPNVDLEIFPNHHFNPLFLNETSPFPFPNTDATTILSAMSSNRPDAPGPMTENQLDKELDNFTKQQQYHHGTNNALTIHQLAHAA